MLVPLGAQETVADLGGLDVCLVRGRGHTLHGGAGLLKVGDDGSDVRRNPIHGDLFEFGALSCGQPAGDAEIVVELEVNPAVKCGEVVQPFEPDGPVSRPLSRASFFHPAYDVLVGFDFLSKMLRHSSPPR